MILGLVLRSISAFSGEVCDHLRICEGLGLQASATLVRYHAAREEVRNKNGRGRGRDGVEGGGAGETPGKGEAAP